MNHAAPGVLGRRAIATMAVVAALAAGCGSSGSKASNTKAGSSSTTSTSTPTTKGSATGSSTPGSSSAGGSGDFCSKISDKEASAVLAVPITRREPSASTAGAGGCIKGTVRNVDIRKAAFVSFSRFPAIGPFASFDQAKAKFPDAKLVSGVADHAFYSPSGGLLFGYQGKIVFEVQVYKFGKRGTESEAVTLAKALASRLG